MNDEKLEMLHLLSNYDSKEITQMLIIMTYWNEMVDVGIVDKDEDVANMSEEKQNKIKEFVTNKLKKEMEKKNNGNKENEKEES